MPHNDPGTVATAVMGIVLLRRLLVISPQPIPPIASGCVLAAAAVAGDQGLININRPIWIALIVVAGAVFGLWERIQRLWTDRESS